MKRRQVALSFPSCRTFSPTATPPVLASPLSNSATAKMSLQLGDFDSDGEGERIVFDLEDTQYPVNPELAALLTTLLALSLCALVCWALFMFVTKWKKVLSWIRNFSHPQPQDDYPSTSPRRPASSTEATAPTVFVHPPGACQLSIADYGFNVHAFSYGHHPRPPCCHVSNSFGNPSYKMSEKEMCETYAF
ncbi:uncharacterized protein LOC135395333 [Ornithodoros turicata]|uniref:uncharacterized protein LOC135395333 n=1 Tax=Ornithodoros turicata TaxID=34597 RepID=UPI003139F207